MNKKKVGWIDELLYRRNCMLASTPSPDTQSSGAQMCPLLSLIWVISSHPHQWAWMLVMDSNFMAKKEGSIEKIYL